MRGKGREGGAGGEGRREEEKLANLAELSLPANIALVTCTCTCGMLRVHYIGS